MRSCKDHRIEREWDSGCFRVVRCACGHFALLTGGAAIRLEARHLEELSGLLNGVREGGVPAVGGTREAEGTFAPGLPTEWAAFKQPTLPAGGMN